ncbi:hypothetical protein EYF80_056804 [Liparis tanakae]|uniref:Uncharacterized protein n=1 Tax=Liparis tanakae TaxID=230148 RepID=A0A4Z2EW67_9TELE|nr:hypothetical protein EYF80_056804 [Liparis tanakae]
MEGKQHGGGEPHLRQLVKRRASGSHQSLLGDYWGLGVEGRWNQRGSPRRRRDIEKGVANVWFSIGKPVFSH